LVQTGHMMKGGTIVDATIINAPSSTKNAEKARDPEMHQTMKGNEWRFGMKCHIGVDAGSGLVHTPAANFPQPDIGAVCHLEWREVKNLRNIGCFSLEFP